MAVAMVFGAGRLHLPRPGLAAAGAPPPPPPKGSTPPVGVDEVVTTADVERAARRLNVELRESIVGPWYEIALYSGERQLGKTSGWAQPWGILHLETIEVRRFTGYWVSKPKLKMGQAQEKLTTAEEEAKKEEEKKRYADVAKVQRWFGLILAVSIGCWNRERSPVYCKEAHLLAIKDEEKQHDRLVRYYKGLGFKTLKENEELSLQDQIVWGGEGTLMNCMSEDFMRKWTPLVRKLAREGARSKVGP